jgi:hypothetical protein
MAIRENLTRTLQNDNAAMKSGVVDYSDSFYFFNQPFFVRNAASDSLNSLGFSIIKK